MFDKLRTYLEKEVKLTEERFDLLRTFFLPGKLKKGAFLQHAAEVYNKREKVCLVRNCCKSSAVTP